MAPASRPARLFSGWLKVPSSRGASGDFAVSLFSLPQREFLGKVDDKAKHRVVLLQPFEVTLC